MQKVRALLWLTVLAPCGVVCVGCGESSSDNKPVMVAPDVPPAQAQKDSMDAYLRDHPGAAKKAGPGVAPKSK